MEQTGSIIFLAHFVEKCSKKKAPCCKPLLRKQELRKRVVAADQFSVFDKVKVKTVLKDDEGAQLRARQRGHPLKRRLRAYCPRMLLPHSIRERETQAPNPPWREALKDVGDVLVSALPVGADRRRMQIELHSSSSRRRTNSSRNYSSISKQRTNSFNPTTTSWRDPFY